MYVRDLHERRTIALAPSATVLALGYDAVGNVQPTQVAPPGFAALWRIGPASGAWMPAPYDWCSLTDGMVVALAPEHGP